MKHVKAIKKALQSRRKPVTKQSKHKLYKVYQKSVKSKQKAQQGK